MNIKHKSGLAQWLGSKPDQRGNVKRLKDRIHTNPVAGLYLIREIYRSAGYSDADFSALSGREAGVEVAESMFRMASEIGFPTRLDEIDGFGRAHIDRALEAAKNPQLRMKLQNMPVPLTADLVDEYMGPILEAAVDGDLSRIKNLSTG